MEKNCFLTVMLHGYCQNREENSKHSCSTTWAVSVVADKPQSLCKPSPKIYEAVAKIISQQQLMLVGKILRSQQAWAGACMNSSEKGPVCSDGSMQVGRAEAELGTHVPLPQDWGCKRNTALWMGWSLGISREAVLKWTRHCSTGGVVLLLLKCSICSAKEITLQGIFLGDSQFSCSSDINR